MSPKTQSGTPRREETAYAKAEATLAIALVLMLILTSCDSSTPYPTSTPTKRPTSAVLDDATVHWWVCGFFDGPCDKCSKSGSTLRDASVGQGTELLRTGEALDCRNETDINGDSMGVVLAEIEDPRPGMDGTIWVPIGALD
jgi:hypothetical protein